MATTADGDGIEVAATSMMLASKLLVVRSGADVSSPETGKLTAGNAT